MLDICPLCGRTKCTQDYPPPPAPSARTSLPGKCGRSAWFRACPVTRGKFPRAMKSDLDRQPQKRGRHPGNPAQFGPFRPAPHL